MSFSDNVIKIFDAIGKQMGVVIDWSNQNVMPYLEQLTHRVVNYELYTSLFWIALAVVILIIGIVVLKKGIKEYKREDRYSYEEKYILFFVWGAVLIGIFCIVGVKESLDVITCITLPEKTLIDFVSQYK